MKSHAPALASRLERLITAGNRLAADRPLEEVLQWVAETGRDLLEARYAAIGLLAPDQRTLESFTTSGITPEQRAAMGDLPTGQGILGAVIRGGEPLRLDDLSDHPDSVGMPEHHPPMRSFLGVPVTGRHGVLGNLYLTEKQGGSPFTAEDEYLAILLAARAASAVEDARRHAETSRLIAEVQTLLRSRERFFAMVNHELRNSVAGVLGWAEMLVRKKDPETVPRAAYEVLEAAEAASGLINDLLDLSRLDEDRMRPEFKAVECRGVLRRAVSRVTPAAEERSVTITVDLPEGLVTCHTDASRVEQILVNVLGNAIRHTAEGSMVTLAVHPGDAEVEMTVTDQGPGIPEAGLERIFDVYFTVPGEEGRGVGLGLPLSRRLARLLGGDLTASNAPEGGARFTLWLPLHSPEP